jgi:hypothetical protein
MNKFSFISIQRAGGIAYIINRLIRFNYFLKPPFLNRLIIILAFLAYPAISNANLLFRSGFEGNVTISQPEVIAGVWTSDIFGSDYDGFNWGDLPGDTNTYVQFIIKQTDVPALSDLLEYVDLKIQSVIGPYGHATKALYMHNIRHYSSGPPNYTGQRLSTNNAAGSVSPNDQQEYFMQYHMKLNDDFESSMNKGSWYLFWETVVRGNTNKIFIKNLTGKLIWQYENGYNDGMIFNKSVPVPLKQWFLVGLYYKHASNSTGRFLLYVNGEEVINYTGPTCTGGGVAATNFLKSYTNRWNVGHWVDNFQIYDSLSDNASGTKEQPTEISTILKAPTNLEVNKKSGTK